MLKENKFCCDEIDYIIREYSVINYDELIRTYNLVLIPNVRVEALYFCPFCGSDLGKRLNEEYYDVLEKEYGIDDPDRFTLTNVPEEFKSDAWWRKRGL